MEPKLLLVHALLLLYWESKLDARTEGSRNLVKDIIESIEPPASSLDTDTDRTVIIGLKNTIITLLREDINASIDKTMLLQRICINTKGDDALYQMIVQSMEGEPEQNILRRLCIDYTRSLEEHRRLTSFIGTVKKWMMDIVYGDISSLGKVSDMAMRIQNDLEPFLHGAVNQGIGSITGMVDFVDFDNVESIKELFLKAQEESSNEGIMKTGYQAINRMMGDYGGFRRGDFIVVGAFQHNYKTGFTLNLTRQIALYNTPFMHNPDKKPLIIHISSENQLTDNLMLMAEGLYENKYGKAFDRTAVSPEQAAEWIKTETMSSGYTLKMHRVNPSEFTYSSLFQLIMEYESMGYEIHLLTIDYLNMFNKAGCVSGFTGADTRDLFRRVRNFCSARKITVMTPHQISMDGKNLLREGRDMIVKELVGKSYWDSCKTIDQEVDVEILVHIEIVDGKKYLTVARGKHRKSGMVTPLKDLFCILPFYPVGAVRDDIHGKDLSIKKLDTRAIGVNLDDDESGFFTESLHYQASNALSKATIRDGSKFVPQPRYTSTPNRLMTMH